jgi:release factor glutamine methyltransferase
MHLLKDLFNFSYIALKNYYNHNQLAYFVVNQLFKLHYNCDYLILDKNIIVEEKLLLIFKKNISDITLLDMPYQYILNKINFCNVIIRLKPPVLIPRVETEELVSWLMTKLKEYKNNYFHIMDLCSGSGCIGLALLDYFNNSICTGFDICHNAVALSSENARINNLNKRYTVYQKNILQLKKNKKYDIIISNPPYISLNNYNKLDKSVALWESKNALTDNSDGNIYVFYILDFSKKKLKKNALLIIEICHFNADIILKEAKKKYLKELVFLWKDQYDKYRALVIIKGNFIKSFDE